MSRTSCRWMSTWHKPKTHQSSLGKKEYSHIKGIAGAKEKVAPAIPDLRRNTGFASTVAKDAERENYPISFPYVCQQRNTLAGTGSKSLQCSCTNKAKLWPTSRTEHTIFIRGFKTWILMKWSPKRAEFTWF